MKTLLSQLVSLRAPARLVRRSLLVLAGVCVAVSTARAQNATYDNLTINDTLTFSGGNGYISQGGFALGLNATTGDSSDYALGMCANATSASTSYAFGNGAKLDNGSQDSFALGTNAYVAGSLSSYAIGYGATSHGDDGFSIGSGAYNNQNKAMAIGYGATANGYQSFALDTSTANSDYSMAIGIGANVDVDSDYAVALGTNAYVPPDWGNTVVVGAGVDSDVTSPLFAVADGTSMTGSNALTILTNGYAGFGDGARNPSEQVEIDGRLRLDADSGSSSSANGTVRWNGTNLQLYSGGNWTTVPNINNGAPVGVGGTQYVLTTAADNTGSSETTLISQSVAAGTLQNTGDRLHVKAVFVFAANGNSKEVRAYFGTSGTPVFDTSSLSFDGSTLSVDLTITRTGASTENVDATATVSGSVAPILGSAGAYFTTASQTLSSALTFKFTGQGGASGDVTQEQMFIEYLPAP
jgi:hypothetical protein